MFAPATNHDWKLERIEVSKDKSQLITHRRVFLLCVPHVCTCTPIACARLHVFPNCVPHACLHLFPHCVFTLARVPIACSRLRVYPYCMFTLARVPIACSRLHVFPHCVFTLAHVPPLRVHACTCSPIACTRLHVYPYYVPHLTLARVPSLRVHACTCTSIACSRLHVFLHCVFTLARVPIGCLVSRALRGLGVRI
jgi:hypothetical protein